VKRRDTAVRPEPEPAAIVKKCGAEPLPGYRLLEPLGQGAFGEVWKCEVPGGLFKAIKFVAGEGYDPAAENTAAEQELDALQRIKAIRHPFILSVERAEVVADELLIVTELADQSLRDVLDECRRSGMPGIPRPRLLALLLEAAEALDVMNFRYGLQHLDVKPGNLFLVSDHIKVADFGQVDSPRAGRAPGAGRPRNTFTPLYAAPEILQGTITRQCDQYSLAVVYQELLTGTLPFTGKSARQLLMQRLTREPNLDPLPLGDRPVAARALARNPDQRFPSCLEFVRALLAVPEAPEERPALPLPPREAAPPDRKAGAPTGIDRRVSVRYTYQAAARARVRARPTYRSDEALLRDISAMGVGLVFPHELAQGTSLFVQLPGKRPGTTATHLAEVVHVVPWPAGAWLVGCKWARPLTARDLRQTLGEGGLKPQE
jgi:serine/threonine protein kinase